MGTAVLKDNLAYITTSLDLEGVNIAQRLARVERGVKDWKAVEIYRWVDPEIGPRAMPDCNEPLKGLVRVDWSDAFNIDLAAQAVKLGNLDLGPSIVYRITD